MPADRTDPGHDLVLRLPVNPYVPTSTVLRDVTANVGLSRFNATPLAFADYDGDSLIDILAASLDGNGNQQLAAWLWVRASRRADATRPTRSRTCLRQPPPPSGALLTPRSPPLAPRARSGPTFSASRSAAPGQCQACSASSRATTTTTEHSTPSSSRRFYAAILLNTMGINSLKLRDADTATSIAASAATATALTVAAATSPPASASSLSPSPPPHGTVSCASPFCP